MNVFDQSTLPIPRTPRPEQREVEEFVRLLDASLTEAVVQGRVRTPTADDPLRVVDLGFARIIEPHLDATAIIDQAGRSDLLTGSDTWAVWAAE